MSVLYVVACGAPPAADLPGAIRLFRRAGWTVCVIATPMALRFVDAAAVEEASGLPVRSEYRLPGEPDPFPPADAVALAPATFNTINKFAAGMSDTLALGVLNELLGYRVPIVAGIWAKQQLRTHPAFPRSVRTLQEAGVRFVADGSGPDGFPWRSVIEELGPPVPAAP